MIDRKEFNNVLEQLPSDKKQIASTILDELVFIEENLAVLRTKPLIKFHPEYPELSKTTPAAKLYKELLGQKNNLIRTLNNTLRVVSSDDDTDPMKDFNDLVDKKFEDYL